MFSISSMNRFFCLSNLHSSHKYSPIPSKQKSLEEPGGIFLSPTIFSCHWDAVEAEKIGFHGDEILSEPRWERRLTRWGMSQEGYWSTSDVDMLIGRRRTGQRGYVLRQVDTEARFYHPWMGLNVFAPRFHSLVGSVERDESFLISLLPCLICSITICSVIFSGGASRWVAFWK